MKFRLYKGREIDFGSIRHRALYASVVILAAFLGIAFFAIPRDYYKVGVMVSSAPGLEGTVANIKLFTTRRAEIINQNGGVLGRPLRVEFLEDHADSGKAYENVVAATRDPRMIALIGCWNSTRASKIIDVVAAAEMPFLGDFSRTDIFEQHENIYTLERSIEDELATFKRFLLTSDRRIVFVGLEGDIFTQSFHDAIVELATSSGTRLVHVEWIRRGEESDKRRIGEIADAVPEDFDFMVLSLGNLGNAKFLTHFSTLQPPVPVFTPLGDLASTIDLLDAYPEEMFDIAVVGIPNTANQRLEFKAEQLGSSSATSRTRSRDIGFGGKYADAIGLIAEAAGVESVGDVEQARRKITEQLAGYRFGAKLYRGWANDWSFTEKRSSSSPALIAWKPRSEEVHRLAKFQYLRDHQLPAPTLYVHIDMVSIDQVNDREGSFSAEFYLELSSAEPREIEDIVFTNAFRSTGDHRPLIHFDEITARKSGNADDLFYRIFRVSGKFLFTPNLQDYPFDRQQFYIALQPSSMLEPFIIQPPPQSLLDSHFRSPGWKNLRGFVGSDQDLIYSAGRVGGDQRILPFYKFTYVWEMKRVGVDYIVKVIAPLIIILTVSWAAIFLVGRDDNTAIMTQVTCLLASVALNLATYKPAGEYATISDRLFIGTYVLITAQILLSVLAVCAEEGRLARFSRALGRVDQYVFPAIVGLWFGILVL